MGESTPQDKTPVGDSRRYEHDCDDCQYLGQIQEYDCYYCKGDGSVIARHGAESAYLAAPANLLKAQGGGNILRAVIAMADAVGAL